MNSGQYLVGDLDRNPDSVLNSMKATISRIGDYNQDEVFGSVQFDLFEMDGGTAVAIVGGEWRDILFNDQYDSLSEGGVIGGSAGNSAGGSRQVSAAYVEAVFPYTDEVEVKLGCIIYISVLLHIIVPTMKVQKNCIQMQFV